MRTFYIRENLDSTCKNAMYKVRTDMMNIFNNKGYKSIKTFYSYKSYKKNVLSKFIIQSLSLFYLLPIFLGKKCNFIIQYPNINGSFYFLCLSKILKIKASNIIVLIHDFDSLRDIGEAEKDKQILNLGHYFIVHNKVMKNLLCKNYSISEEKIFELNLFDYLSTFKTENVKKDFDKNRINIVFAGNLSKSKFLNRLVELKKTNIIFQLFGVGIDSSILKENIVYNGSLSSEELTERISKYDFGLVWDGDELSSCSGSYGEYLRINTPHKTSMCITACLPVICWKESAIANYIISNNLGVAVSSLYELDNKLNEIDAESYLKMLDSVKKEADKLGSGKHLSNILDEII